MNSEKIELNKEKNLLEVMIEKGINILAPCNGKGTCGKCKIKLISGKVNEITKTEKKILSKKELGNNIRLACRVKMESNIEIEVLNKLENVNLKKLNLDEGIEKRYIAIMDLGTTTVKLEFYNEKTLELEEKISFYSPQIRYGADVLSRIGFAIENEENLINIQKTLITKLNEIQIMGKTGKLIIAGNSAMQTLFLGMSPISLTIPPYNAPFLDGKIVSSKKIGLEMLEGGEITIFPNLAGFVGGDSFSMLAYYISRFPKENNVILIDIGTNGEIILIKDGKYIVTSTAAGPAFEGASIEYGMRAIEGAVKRVVIDEKMEIETIGETKILGLSGSGIISLISELIVTETIDEFGKLKKENKLYPFLNKHLKNGKFYLNETVYITQKDIREIQLAKSAIRTAIDFLLEKEKISEKNIKKIILTGNFGNSLKIQDLIRIGILSKAFENKVEVLENLVLSGLRDDMYNKLSNNITKEISGKIDYLNIAKIQKSDKKFIKNINFL